MFLLFANYRKIKTAGRRTVTGLAVKRDEGVKTVTAGSHVSMMDKKGTKARRCVAFGLCRLKVAMMKMKASNPENKATGDVGGGYNVGLTETVDQQCWKQPITPPTFDSQFCDGLHDGVRTDELFYSVSLTRLLPSS